MTECEIKEYVDRRMRAMLDTYHEFSDVDHKGNAGFYPNGEKAYYEDTIFGLIRYYRENGKGLSKAWIKQTPNQRIKDLVDVIAYNTFQYQESYKCEVYDIIDDFLLFYLQWEKLDKLLKNTKPKETSNISFKPLEGMFNEDLERMFKADLRRLESEFTVSDEKKCRPGVFAAICYYILNSRSEIHQKQKYIHEFIDFEAFKRAMSESFCRKAPSFRKDGAQKALDDMDINKKRKLEKLFI